MTPHDEGDREQRPGPLARFFAGITLKDIILFVGVLGGGGYAVVDHQQDVEKQQSDAELDNTMFGAVAYTNDRLDSVIVVMSAADRRRIPQRIRVLEDKVFKGRVPARLPGDLYGRPAPPRRPPPKKKSWFWPF